uniref:Uncharacterized protein n=1 Tax=Arundo donax TaxID=35708 RepID=A0A0A9AE81_ARUDO
MAQCSAHHTCLLLWHYVRANPATFFVRPI